MRPFLKAIFICIVLQLAGLAPAAALPVCSDIFQDPPLGNQGLNTLQPPSGILVPPFTNFTCGNNATCDFPRGDRDYNHGSFRNRSELTTNGPTTRLYFNSLSLNNAQINTAGDPEDLFIYVAGSLSIAGQNEINAIIYVNGSVSFSGNAELEGALASGGSLQITGNTDVDIDLDAVDQADLSGICDSTPEPTPLELQFGSTSLRTVTFSRPFPNGVTPLVFLMPTIDAADPADDGPASLFLTSISDTGFSFEQAQPPFSSQADETMTDVSWIAVTPGTHTLPNGDTLQAGSIETNSSIRRTTGDYDDVSLAAGLNVALNQLQTNNNNCWLTSTSLLSTGNLALSLDLAEAYFNNNRCAPGNISQSNLQDETIAYLALESGAGSMDLFGETVNYQFANFNTGNGSQLAQQCAATSSLTGFGTPPVLVGAMISRNGRDGGWLRRCRLSASLVSMVIDEDQFRDNERGHTGENYSIAAFEIADNRPLQCFGDNFSTSTIGNDWDVTVLGSSRPPYITGNRLRLTEDRPQQSVALTFQKLFPAADNLVVVEFDYFSWSPRSGTGADGITVIFSDGEVDPNPGSFGGSLGYAQRNNGDAGFAGGWLGVGLDEWGNFSNPTEGRVGGPGFRRQAVAIRGSEASRYNYLAGTGAFLSPRLDVRRTNTPAPGHRYRVTLDSRSAGSTMVSVARNTNNGAGFVELIAPFDAQAANGQGAVPDDFILSLTGSTGGAFNNHEIDNFEVCAIEARDIGASIDHFEIGYSSSPLTCTPEVVTVRACLDASCSQLATDPVSVDLSLSDTNAATWEGGGSITLINGIAQVSLQGLTTSPVTMGISASTPAAVNPLLCSRGGANPTAAQCEITFADSGFIIDIQDKLAGQPITASISAVRQSDDALVCTPAFASTSKTVGFWSSYGSPTTPLPVANSPQVELNGTEIGRSEALATGITLNFDSQGRAPLTVNYADAGQLYVNAKYTGVAGEDDEGILMTGSDDFVSAPVGLCVEPDTTCSAADGTCPPFKRAGENFTLAVSGRAWVSGDDGDLCNNPVTPNYAQNNIVLGSQLVAPVGGAAGVTGMSAYNHQVAEDGINELEQSVSEVGVFTFSAAPPANYLGSTSAVAQIAAASSMATGRFVPAEFLITTPSLSPACGIGGAGFSYMGQPFSLDFTATARNVQHQQTQNFVTSATSAENFAFATALLAAENNNDGIDLATRLSNVPSLSWVNGVATVTSHQLSFDRLAAPTLDGPFAALDIGVIIEDSDGFAGMANADMDAGTTGDCLSATCTSARLGTQALRFGRLVMDNVYGPETETLAMPLRAEYWDGVNWSINTLDSCTAAGTGPDNFNPALLFAVDDLSGYVYEPDLLSGQTVTRTGNGSLLQGRFNLNWQASGTPLYRGAVQAPLAVPEWLRFYWNWDGASPNVNIDPRANAFFGTFRGNDKVIYWRENR